MFKEVAIVVFSATSSVQRIFPGYVIVIGFRMVFKWLGTLLMLLFRFFYEFSMKLRLRTEIRSLATPLVRDGSELVTAFGL